MRSCYVLVRWLMSPLDTAYLFGLWRSLVSYRPPKSIVPAVLLYISIQALRCPKLSMKFVSFVTITSFITQSGFFILFEQLTKSTEARKRDVISLITFILISLL